MTLDTPKTPSYRRITSSSLKKSTPLSSSCSTAYKKRKSSCSKIDPLCKTAWALAPARFSEGAIIGGSCHDLFVQTTNATHNNSQTKRKKERLSWTCSEKRHHDHLKTLNNEQDVTNHNTNSRQVDEKKVKNTTRHNEKLENDNQTISNQDVPKEIHVTKLFFDSIDKVAAISIDDKQNNLSSDIENPVIVEHLLQKLHDKDLYIQKLKMVIESHEKVIELLSRKRNNEQEVNHKYVTKHIHNNDKIGIHEQSNSLGYAASRSIQLSEEELYRLKQDISNVHSELRLLKESLAVASASVMKNCESLKLYVNEEVKDNIKVVDDAVNAIKQELQERNNKNTVN